MKTGDLCRRKLGDLRRRICFHCLKYMAVSDYFDLIILILRLIREQVLVDDIISRGHWYCFGRTLREREVRVSCIRTRMT